MYFTESERLARTHPDLARVIEAIDGQLYSMGNAEVLRMDDLASVLRADPNQVDSTLGMLARDGLLQPEQMVECVHCRMTMLRSDYDSGWENDGEYRCTSCDRPLTNQTIVQLTTYRRGAKWRQVQPNANSQANRAPGDLDEQAWYRYDRLAEAFGVGKDALRKRLDRFREENLNGYKENEDRRPREPKYLYQLQAVRAVIEDLRASSERPAK
jgi:hypothetical protein